MSFFKNSIEKTWNASDQYRNQMKNYVYTRKWKKQYFQCSVKRSRMKPNGVEIVLKILPLLYEYNVNSTSFIVQCLNAGASDAVALFFEKKKRKERKRKKKGNEKFVGKRICMKFLDDSITLQNNAYEWDENMYDIPARGSIVVFVAIGDRKR